MKFSTLIQGSLLGLCIYLFLELIFGMYGLIAYRQVKNSEVQVVADLKQVELYQGMLQEQIAALTTDEETIRLEARDIGFVDKGETVLRIENRAIRNRYSYLLGVPPAVIPAVKDNRRLFRSIAFVVLLLRVLLGNRLKL